MQVRSKKNGEVLTKVNLVGSFGIRLTTTIKKFLFYFKEQTKA